MAESVEVMAGIVQRWLPTPRSLITCILVPKYVQFTALSELEACQYGAGTYRHALYLPTCYVSFSLHSRLVVSSSRSSDELGFYSFHLPKHTFVIVAVNVDSRHKSISEQYTSLERLLGRVVLSASTYLLIH